MASEAQKKEQQWNEYCSKLARAGAYPPEDVARGYAQASKFFNTCDSELISVYNNAMNQYK